MPLSDNRTLARRLNRLIDLGLEGRHIPLPQLLRVSGEPQACAERIRRRATRRIHRHPASAQATLARRDQLMESVYARAAGTRHVAWCDASWRPGSYRVGVAALIANHRGEIQGSLQQHSPDGSDSVSAEALAVTLAATWAVAQGGDALTAYSDCKALVLMWHERRRDPRLRELRRAVRSLPVFYLRFIAREHNQPAHRLARAAARTGTPSGL